MKHQTRFDAGYRMLGAVALDDPEGWYGDIIRPISIRNCLESNIDFQGGPGDLTTRVKVLFFLHFPSLPKTSLGHTGTAHEETGCRRVSESVWCRTVFT